jgi:uncharacterized protein (TIGR02145 family)
MKKFLLSMMLCLPMALAAQSSNGVIVSGLAINAGTVTVNVGWENTDMPPLWSDSVWVFVDYNSNGVMKRLPVTAATASAGTVTMAPNNKGVWIIGNARSAGSFSATVTLLTATTTATGACAYASNYPPVGEYISDTEISFIGTPMYDVVLEHSNGSTVTVQSGGTFLLPCDYTLQSFTDATTGAPGIMKCIPMTGSIDFSVPLNITKGATTSFVVSSEPTTPNPALITYHWSAPDFIPATQTGKTFTVTAPGTVGIYPIKLTAQSEKYCPLAVTKSIEVANCTAPGSTVNFTAFSPCSNATTGDYWYLTDTRELNNVQTYKVKKMADGRIWQVQDMKFGDKCNKTSFAGSSSDQQGKVSTTFPNHYGDCRNNPVSGAGYFYDWAAAINKAGAYHGGSYAGCSGTTTAANVCQGICPDGWHVPTGSSGGDFGVAYTAFKAVNNCNNDNCWNASSAWEGVISGICNSSGTIGETSINQTKSATLTGNFVYELYWGVGSLNIDDTGNNYRNCGSIVRCIRNY